MSSVRTPSTPSRLSRSRDLYGHGVEPMLRRRHAAWLTAVLVAISVAPPSRARAAVTREQVENAITKGVRYLKSTQKNDGSWPQFDDEHNTGVTSLVVLSLLTAGEP